MQALDAGCDGNYFLNHFRPDLRGEQARVAGNGSGTTIALVDPYDDPNVANDLHKFDLQFGLPDAPSFQKVSQTGSTTTLPPSSSGWTPAAAESMDMISAICPNCHILLVEANSPSIDDLGTGVNEAVTLGAKFVDNDWYKSEASIGSAETTYDS